MPAPNRLHAVLAAGIKHYGDSTGTPPENEQLTHKPKYPALTDDTIREAVRECEQNLRTLTDEERANFPVQKSMNFDERPNLLVRQNPTAPDKATVWVHPTYGPMEDWDVSQVTNMENLFDLEGEYSTDFNVDLSRWDVSNVTDMSKMFHNRFNFNQPLNAWGSKLANVTDMFCMFQNAVSFNQDLYEWDVSNVDDMRNMFKGAVSFNGDISTWNVTNVNPEYGFSGMLNQAGYVESRDGYDWYDERHLSKQIKPDHLKYWPVVVTDLQYLWGSWIDGDYYDELDTYNDAVGKEKDERRAYLESRGLGHMK